MAKKSNQRKTSMKEEIKMYINIYKINIYNLFLKARKFPRSKKAHIKS